MEKLPAQIKQSNSLSEFEMKSRKLMFETEIVYFFSTTLTYTVFLKSRFDFDYSFFFGFSS